MKLQQRASRSWAKTSRLAALPSWSNMVGVAVLVIIALVLVFKAISPSTAHTVPTVPLTSITVPSTTAGGS